MTSASTAASRHRFYSDATDDEWNDWKWQTRNRERTLSGLERVLELTADERAAIEARGGALPLGVTPYYVSLFDL